MSTERAAPPDDLVSAVDAVFSPSGPLSAVLGGFEPREGQRQMAAAVADTFESGGVLLAEAGTGTGKTLAYLVPAILSGRQVLVSTGTKNLQEQILYKDLPVLQRVLDVPFTAVCMKGRSNYLCLHRFDRARQDRPPAEAGPGLSIADRLCLPAIEDWVETTGTGDRAELTDLPEDLPLWTELSASAENCLGTDCPRHAECFVTRMRQRAADSDVIIVNHHLLFADASVRRSAYGEVIPACDYAVLDEAHQLEEIATQYFGVSVSTWRVDELVRDVEHFARSFLDGRPRAAVQSGAERVRDRGRLLFLACDAARSGPEDRPRLAGDLLERAAEPGHALAATLEGLEATLVLLRPSEAAAEHEAAPQAAEDLRALARRTRELRGDLQFLLQASDPDYVFFAERRGRGVFLRAAPIDVSRIVRDEVLDRRHVTVLTSATLTVDQSFDYARGRLGIARAAELRVPSEFDYRRQSILYLPRHMPPPRSPAFAEAAGREIVEILRRTRGRAFVLFTSYAVMRAVEGIVAMALDYPILVQGTAPRSTLLDRFRTTPHAVLLATSSFWQGVDVVGEALSCVIVDKLPFASPGDPVTAARLEAIAARGGDPFSEYQVPLAILTLQQGLGRLLRHRLDRGVLAVLDPRLRTMGYGRRFLASLPPSPVTSDPDAIDRFLAG